MKPTSSANGSLHAHKPASLQPKIIYSEDYDISLYGIERLHPFDSHKYSRIWMALKDRFGPDIDNLCLSPGAPVSRDDLQRVHCSSYLDQLESKFTSSATLARALQLPFLSFLPSRLLSKAILAPMKWATSGTVLASREALMCQMVFNLSGGYHHAEEGKGDGFCVYSDVAVAISVLRFEQQIQSGDQIVIIDLDAHQGNGLERIFMNDPSVHFFDMYNADIYPQDDYAKSRINCNLPIESGTDGSAYLQILKDHLSPFLDRLNPDPKLAFYVAGTDVYDKDPLGEIKVSKDQILCRDMFVVSTLCRRKIPLVMLLGGGYTRESHKIASQSIGEILSLWGQL